MYIVAIAWIYVVLLMSLTEESVAAGLATFLFYGLAPLALLLYLMGTPRRRRNRRKREALREEAAARAQESAGSEKTDSADDLRDSAR
jgi:protein involved in temperature-dependent protein secretion